MNSIRSSNPFKSFTSQAYKEGVHSQIKDSCITFELRSKSDSENETNGRRFLFSKSIGKKKGLSQRKSRF